MNCAEKFYHLLVFRLRQPNMNEQNLYSKFKTTTEGPFRRLLWVGTRLLGIQEHLLGVLKRQGFLKDCLTSEVKGLIPKLCQHQSMIYTMADIFGLTA